MLVITLFSFVADIMGALQSPAAATAFGLLVPQGEIARAMEPQSGDDEPQGVAFGSPPPRNTARCFLTYTNERTHEIIRANLSRSPLFTGVIEGVGPRYCPSIEDKVVRFPEKKRHQLFLEPCGAETAEYYVQGMMS